MLLYCMLEIVLRQDSVFFTQEKLWGKYRNKCCILKMH
uniref:Uncharacterized protein n=1 Tax=Anguilla anguilla TaxID=7936 RepID=A0A0E9QIT0_ANGAN